MPTTHKKQIVIQRENIEGGGKKHTITFTHKNGGEWWVEANGEKVLLLVKWKNSVCNLHHHHFCTNFKMPEDTSWCWREWGEAVTIDISRGMCQLLCKAVLNCSPTGPYDVVGFTRPRRPKYGYVKHKLHKAGTDLKYFYVKVRDRLVTKFVLTWSHHGSLLGIHSAQVCWEMG